MTLICYVTGAIVANHMFFAYRTVVQGTLVQPIGAEQRDVCTLIKVALA